ncbi:MAG TPA: carbamoyltransferase C-terminal domain-containing protein [Verrucomicrobiae bacterium]
MNLILGLNAFHPDSSACVLQDGKLVAAVAEERLGARHKHVAGFPGRAIAEVLRMAGATIRDVDHVAIGNDSNANVPAKVRHVLKSPVKSARGVLTHFQRRGKMHSVQRMMAEACGVNEADCRFQTARVEHHLAHIASSYFASDFDEAAGFSYDGSGDFTSAMFARCRENKIEILDRVHVPHSLGFFYTALCQFIGFSKFGEEYKVMGLAAYGQPVHLELMRELVSVQGESFSASHGEKVAAGRMRCSGQFRLNPRFFRPLGKNLEECVDATGEIVLPPLYSEELARHLGAPRVRGEPLTQRENDIACSVQARFEEVVLAGLLALHRRVPTDKLVTAGGCALNGVCNARILRETPFQKSYIQCAASDDGTAIGAALYVWNALLNQPRAGLIDHASWGPEHSTNDMEQALHRAGLKFEKFDRAGLLQRAAAHLNSGHVTGWYQGRSEWGPRALGNRSILAHPGWPGMKDLINQKIKRREAFRPFAPTILAEAVPDYFEQNVESPFMMHVVKIKPDKRAALAAVCHEDNTGRLHTVKQSQNALYYDLIKAFSQKSGTPVVLNTSFNENEPIVDTPQQAVDCFVRTDMDVLCLGPFVTTKPGKAELKS